MELVKTLMRRPLDRVLHRVSYCLMRLEEGSEMGMFIYWRMYIYCSSLVSLTFRMLRYNDLL